MAENEKAMEPVQTESATNNNASTDLEREISRLKSNLSRANSEAAEYKRKYQDTLSDAEKERLAREEQDRSIQEELKALRRDKTVSSYKSKYLEAGYDPASADKLAIALADGDVESIFSTQKAFIDQLNANAKTQALQSQPKLTPGKAPGAELAKQAEAERLKSYWGL